jgi:1-acyl-sn-glycerol-3-phosphate acyltransferase
VHADATILPACITGSNHPRKWLYRGSRVRITFGTARHWRAFAGPEDPVPGRMLYQRIGDEIMREIAVLKKDHDTSASLGAA